MRLIGVLVLIFIAFLPALSQRKSCCEPPDLDFDDLPEATPLPGHGNSHLAITTFSDSAQYYFDQGLNMLHSFAFAESYMAFKKAVAIDTNCLSCYIGLVVILDRTDKYNDAYYDALTKAGELQWQDRTYEDFGFKEYEHMLYTATCGVVYQKYKRQDTMRYNSLKRLYEQYPEEEQFHALWLDYLDDGVSHSGEPIGDTEEAGPVADSALKKFPNSSAIQHYYIHLYEDWKPEKVLPLAETIKALGPNSGHLVHMPGHAYFYNGLYEKASEAFKESYYVDSAYIARNKFAKDVNWNIMHNLFFLVMSLTEEGKIEEARTWHKKLSVMSQYDYPEDVDANLSIAWMSRLHIPWRISNWEDAMVACEEASEALSYDWTNEYYYDGTKIFFEGMLAFQLDKRDTLAIFSKRLKKHIKDTKSYAKKHDEKPTKAKHMKMGDHLKAYHAILEMCYDEMHETDTDFDERYGEIEPFVDEMEVGDPPKMIKLAEEVAAEILEKRKAYDEAVKYLEKALEKRPNSGIILLNMARMYGRAGNRIKAREYLDKFKQKWAHADPKLIEFEKARVLETRINQ